MEMVWPHSEETCHQCHPSVPRMEPSGEMADRRSHGRGARGLEDDLKSSETDCTKPAESDGKLQ